MTDRTIEELHLSIDKSVLPVQEKNRARLRCKPGCASCCVDGITVFAVEADLIARHYGDLLERALPHAEGACAFLDDQDRCRIYEHRPYVCRTQGLPLRWMDEDETGHIVEMRDICPLNEEGPPVEELGVDDCWTIGPFEERLAGLQHRFGGAAMTRVRLRTLFRRS